MNVTLGKELNDAIHQLGQLMKADSRCQEYMAAETAYVTSPELNRYLAEYNANQAALAAEYGKGDGGDKEVIAIIERRISELYDAITENAAYTDFIRAKESYELFMQEVRAELEYAISGKKPCTHDCSTCGGCH